MSAVKVFCLMFKSRYWLGVLNSYQMCGMDQHKGFYLHQSPLCSSWTFPWSLMRFLQNFRPVHLKTEICLVEWTAQVQKRETRTGKNLLKPPIRTQSRHQCWLKRKISAIENEDIKNRNALILKPEKMLPGFISHSCKKSDMESSPDEVGTIGVGWVYDGGLVKVINSSEIAKKSLIHVRFRLSPPHGFA